MAVVMAQGGEASPLVRPYAVTGGRTHARRDLAIEALVVTSALGRLEIDELTPECRSICELCRETRSVAEVAALLQVPLGVARVLISDLVDSELVAVHQPMVSDGEPDLMLLERVLSGLRRL